MASRCTQDQKRPIARPFFVLLPVHPHKLLHQLIFGLHMSGIPDDAVDRADTDAGRLLIVTDALGAATGVDLVDLLTQADSLVGALGIAHVTVDALVGDEQRHLRPPCAGCVYPGCRPDCAAKCRSSHPDLSGLAHRPRDRCPARYR